MKWPNVQGQPTGGGHRRSHGENVFKLQKTVERTAPPPQVGCTRLFCLVLQWSDRMESVQWDVAGYATCFLTNAAMMMATLKMIVR